MAFKLEFEVTINVFEKMGKGKGIFLSLDALFCLLPCNLLARCDV